MVAVLQLDAAGVPHRWIPLSEAAIYHAKGLVLWSLGAPMACLRGGINARTGERSVLEVPQVIAVSGSSFCAQDYRTPKFGRRFRKLVMARDLWTCGYCAQRFDEDDLTIDHVHPESMGGATSFTNCLAACKRCNAAKAARLDWQPIWLPYQPCRNEAFILANRKVLADQYAYLSAKLPKHSRLLAA